MGIIANVLGGAVQLSGNPIEIELSGGQFPHPGMDYKLLLKVTSLDGKLDGSPWIDAKAPDTEGKRKFDISALVDQPVGGIFQYPVTSAYASYPTQAFNVQVTPGESYIDNTTGDLVEVWSAPATAFQLLKGGSNNHQLNKWDAAGSNFYEEYLVNGRFLTPRPWGESVLPKQPVKLWFMVVSNTAVVYHIKAEYFDGSIDELTYSLSLNMDYLYEFNCNPILLGMNPENASGKKISHFDVWLDSSGVDISDRRRFHFDHRYFERPVFLLYTNSLGGIDDMFMGGYTVESMDIEGSVYYKPRQSGDTVYDRTLMTSHREGNNIWRLNSGKRITEQMPDYRDLLLSEQVWMIYPNKAQTKYQFVPVIIEPGSIELLDRQQGITDFAITVSEAHVIKHAFDNRINF